jgi:hypothetical protein
MRGQTGWDHIQEGQHQCVVVRKAHCLLDRGVGELLWEGHVKRVVCCGSGALEGVLALGCEPGTVVP